MTSMGSAFLAQVGSFSLEDGQAKSLRPLSDSNEEDNAEKEIEEHQDEKATVGNAKGVEGMGAIFLDTRSSYSRQFPRDYVLEMPLSPDEDRGKVLQSPLPLETNT